MRNALLGLGLCVITAFGTEGPAFSPILPEPVWNAPQNSVFYDHPLIVQQYGFGVVGGVVAGALGFYIGNAFEGAIFDADSKKGYLSFTGIRYRHMRGPFWGGGTGLLFGSALTVFFIGDSDEEQGGIWSTLLGGTLTTAAAFALADMADVQKERGWVPFIPLLTLPPLGSVVGYHLSRWFNDKERRKSVEPGSARLLPPRLGFSPTPDGLALKLDAVNLSF